MIDLDIILHRQIQKRKNLFQCIVIQYLDVISILDLIKSRH